MFYTTSIDATGISAGASGANATWDFSQHSPLGTSYTINVANLAGSPYQSQFAGATIYTEYVGTSNREFFVTSNSEFSRRGVIAGGGPTMDYTNTHKILTFPFTFNSTLSDTYAANFTTTLTFDRAGNTTSSGDAYGTLILPGGQSFANVLRVKLVENSTDSYMGSPMFTSNTENYYWFLPGTHYPLFTISTATASTGQSSTFATMSSATAVSTSEEFATGQLVQVYPNPAKGFVTVRTGIDEPVTALLINSLGQEVRKQVVLDTEGKLSLQGISSGIYLLQLQSGQKSITKKLVVE